MAIAKARHTAAQKAEAPTIAQPENLLCSQSTLSTLCWVGISEKRKKHGGRQSLRQLGLQRAMKAPFCIPVGGWPAKAVVRLQSTLRCEN